MTELKTPRQDLYQIIAQLENPDVRLEDNGPYRVSPEVLGILYANIVSAVTLANSPGIMVVKHPDLSSDVVQEFQKRFQAFSRLKMFQFLGELVVRQSTAMKLKEKYHLDSFNHHFSPGSIEIMVADMTTKNNFSKISTRLKEGAEAYHKLAVDRGGSGYRFAAEYIAIRNALRR